MRVASGAAEQEQGAEAELLEEVEVEHHQLPAFLDGLEVRHQHGEERGVDRLKLVQVEFVFLAAADAVEEQADGLVQEHGVLLARSGRGGEWKLREAGGGGAFQQCPSVVGKNLT
jgi:hypothetical protein